MSLPMAAAIAVYTLVAADFIWRLHANKPVCKHTVEKSDPGSENTSVDAVVFSPPGITNRIPRNVQLMFLGLSISTLFLLIRAIYRLVEVCALLYCTASYTVPNIPLTCCTTYSSPKSGEVVFNRSRLISMFSMAQKSSSLWSPSTPCILDDSYLQRVSSDIPSPKITGLEDFGLNSPVWP